MNDIDVALDYVVGHIHHFDNIRWRNGEWSMQLWLDKINAGSSPIRITGQTIEQCADRALDVVMAWRIDQHSMSIEAATRIAVDKIHGERRAAA